MKAMTKTQLIIALAVAMPLLQSCGKARYQQVRTPPPHAAPSDIPPARESMGPMTVRPAQDSAPAAPPADAHQAPPPNESGEQPSVIVTTAEPPRSVPPLAPPGEWMDPSHYNSARRSSSPPSWCPPHIECFIGDYTQPRGLVTGKLDLVFVIDTSESIFKERASAAAGIDSFMSALPSDVDYRIGVVAAHGESTGLAGEMVRIGSEPAVLSSGEMSRERMRQALHAKLVGVRQDGEADGGELGLYSLDRAISGDKLAKNMALGMFRRDAGLAVVFLSDENDICSLGEYPHAKKDPNGKEVPAYKKYCEGSVDAGSVYRKLMRLKAEGYDERVEADAVSKPLLMAAIVYTDPATVPAKDSSDKWAVENEVGYGYLDIVGMNNGITVDLAQGDIPGALARIGGAVRSKLSLKTEFLIHETRAIDAETMCVLVDGHEVPYAFDGARRQINLSTGGAPGSKIEIFYCAEKGGGPSDGLLDEAGGRGARRITDPSFIDPRCVSVRQRLAR